MFKTTKIVTKNGSFDMDVNKAKKERIFKTFWEQVTNPELGFTIAELIDESLDLIDKDSPRGQILFISLGDYSKASLTSGTLYDITEVIIARIIPNITTDNDAKKLYDGLLKISTTTIDNRDQSALQSMMKKVKIQQQEKFGAGFEKAETSINFSETDIEMGSVERTLNNNNKFTIRFNYANSNKPKEEQSLEKYDAIINVARNVGKF